MRSYVTRTVSLFDFQLHVSVLSVLLIALAMAAPTSAQDAPSQKVPPPSVPAEDEVPADSANADTEAERRLLPPSYGINGLVVDETRTTIGRDFYDVFYDAWLAPENSINYTIAIEEQPVPGRGTRLIVRLNGEIAFDTRLLPRYEQIQQAALAAVGYTRRALASAAPLSRGI